MIFRKFTITSIFWNGQKKTTDAFQNLDYCKLEICIDAAESIYCTQKIVNKKFEA